MQEAVAVGKAISFRAPVHPGVGAVGVGAANFSPRVQQNAKNLLNETDVVYLPYKKKKPTLQTQNITCLLYTSPSPRDS